MKNYYETPRQYYVISPRVLHIFICTDMKNHMIATHPRLSTFIYFICTDPNNLMIANHLRISANDKHIIRKSCLMSLSYVYSTIQLYIRRHICTYFYMSCSSPRWDNLPSGYQIHPLKGLNLRYMY